MARNIRALGLAIVAVAAMSMAVAASAQASQAHITTPNQAVVTAQQAQPHVFKTSAGTVTCKNATFEGTVVDPGGSAQGQITTQDLTVTATYSECEAFGLAATVQMNGCKYTLTGKANKNQGATAGGGTGYVDITDCTPNKQIVVNAAGGLCVATVHEQHDLSHIVATNTQQGTDPHHSHANITITGITYELHGAFCPGGGATGTRHDGEYQGQSTIRAYVKAGQHQVQEHGHQFEKQTEGAQVGILIT